MNDEQLVQFAKEQISAGKGFAEIQTDFLMKYQKNMSEANRLLGIAKSELGMPEDITETDIKEAKNKVLGQKINLLSWALFILSLIVIYFESKSNQLGMRLFVLAFLLSGVSIYLRERIKISFFHVNGFFAKLIGGFIALAMLISFMGTF